MIREAPRIETERLVLRPWRKDDFRPWHAIVSKPEVHRFLSAKPMSAEDCWRRLMASVGCWPLNGFGTWGVEVKGDSRLVGMVGFFTAWRDIDPQFGDEPEMGWIMDPETQGHGLASEAGKAAIAWLEGNVEPVPVWAIISPDNQPSLNLAGKLGFERVKDVLYNDDPTVVLRRPAWA